MRKFRSTISKIKERLSIVSQKIFLVSTKEEADAILKGLGPVGRTGGKPDTVILFNAPQVEPDQFEYLEGS